MKEYIERASVHSIIERTSTFAFTRGGMHEKIDSLPDADVVEVRHGRWIEDERTYPGPGLKNNLCSVCGEIAGSWKEGLEPGRKWAYCPNCGARMDKEAEHGD